MEKTIKDKKLGGMWGLLIGDAFGVPYEFNRPEQLPKITASMFAPENFQKTYSQVPFGTWSDDGAHALCLAASLIEKSKLDIEDLGQKLLKWYKNGYMAVDGIVFDCGITTQKALTKIASGFPANKSGATGNNNNGNGSLMRVLPLAIWHKGSDAQLIADAHLQSKVTHNHVISQICCALYCLWARYTLKNYPNPWKYAFENLKKYYNPKVCKNILDELDNNKLNGLSIKRNHYQDIEIFYDILEKINQYNPQGTGFVIDCLVSAKLANEEGSFSDIIIKAVSLGNDTDTTACVAGGIAGLKYGFKTIPTNLFEDLRGKELAKPIIEALCEKT